ncbi:MAG TPA: ParB/RepB/Spo0J family partition protein [Thermoanaerobaculia bacterium]|nr:ParB/RepB/Spo0J family partition protein [Thermoanaerobaculia bacterium]
MNPKKRGLGRGLDALLEKTEEPVHTLPVASLRPNRFQPRTTFDDSAIEELAESIRSQGLVQPLVVTPAGDGTYAIIAGERRWRAARRAGLEAVPVVVRAVADDRELLELALVENLQRSDLSAIEEAEAYLALQEKFGLSQDEIATRVGKGRPTVTNALRLLRLPEEVRDLLRGGQLTAGQARPLLSLETPEEQIELALRAVREGLSARQIERLVAMPKEAPKKKPPQPVEVHAAAAQEKLTRRLQTRVEIRRRGKGGLLQIHFHSEEELMRLYDVLMERGENR